MSDNPSFVLQGIEQVVFEDRPIPENPHFDHSASVGEREVLVAVKKTGICGSDVHFLVHGRIADFVVENPMVLGHESSGVVHKVGSKVVDLKPGDRVSMEPGATCGQCDDCKKGRYNLCPYIEFAATPPHDGTLCRYYRIPAHVCYKLPDSLSLEDGALIEPLSVATHALNTLGKLKSNESVAIFGAGPIGLVCMAVARALGAKRIIAVDIVPSRLEFAKAYAATDVYLPPAMEAGEDKIKYTDRNAKTMREQLGLAERGPRSIDLVIEASGAEASIRTGISIARMGGRFVQVGMGNPEVTIPITMLLVKELQVIGSLRYGAGDYELAIALVTAGKIDLKPLVTHRFSFEQAKEAFAANRAGKGPDGKPVIKSIISGPGVSPDEH
ncbi:hypothetical protein EIP86_002026 [Pleurotus ostreatoroseus]|nr:hypothetical protein EIP86_002026 [Pleurotus ostreatoroseus]